MPTCPRCTSDLDEGEGPCPACGFDPLEEVEAPGRPEANPATMKAITEAIESVSKALETGLDVANAQAELTEAQEALADGDEEAARDHATEAKRLAEDAKRYGRAANMVERTKREFERLSREGIILDQANVHLGAAEEALAKGLYGEVQNHVRLAREAATEAKRRAAALSLLQREQAKVNAEARRGVDISRVMESLNESQAAITTMNSQEFRRSMQDARLELKLALERKKLEDAVLGVREEAEDLGRQGVDVGQVRELLDIALDDATELRDAWQALGRARRTARSLRDKLHREVIANTVSRIVEHAARGDFTAGQARQLIEEVQESLEKGEAVQVEAMIEGRLAGKDTDRVRATSRALQNITERLLTLRRAEIELIEADASLQDVKGYLDAGKFDEADRLLSDLQETTEDMLAVVRESTEAMLRRADAQVQLAAAAKLDVNDAAKMLEGARGAFAQGRLPDAIEMAKSAELQASGSLAEYEEARRREEERRRGSGDRLLLVQGRLAQAREDMRALASAGLDVRPAEEPVQAAEAAAERQALPEAERALVSAESMLSSLWAALRREAQNTLDRARRQLKGTETELLTPETRTLLEKAERAFEEKHFRLCVELAEAFLASLDRARHERASERTRMAEERASRAQEQVTRVRTLMEQVRAVLGDAEAADEAERALNGVTDQDMDTQVAAVGRIAERLGERLRVTAEASLRDAEQDIREAAGLGADVDDAQLEFELGGELFDKGDYVGANKHAKGAMKRAQGAADRRREDLEVERRRRAEAARSLIGRVKAIVEDLGRADIQMEGCGEAVRLAHKRYEEGDYDAVVSTLEPFLELSASLSEGLKTAAETFLQKEHVAILAAMAEGLEVPRAEKVLATAQQAVTDQKYVEALEYHKVISDIITDARRQRELALMAAELETLRKELERGVPGQDNEQIAHYLRVAEEHMKKGSFEQFRTEVRRARDVLDTARRALIAGRLERMGKDIAAARELGAEIPLAEDLFEEAKLAAGRGDLAALVEYGERIAEISDQARRALLRQRSVRELREVREMVEGATRAGLDVSEADEPLREAEEALQEGAYDDLASSLERARSLVAAVRRKHFEETYGDRLRALQVSVAEAAAVGVSGGAVEPHLDRAATAIGSGDFDAADLALQKAQVEADRQIARYLGHRHPNLQVRVQEAGLQADRWNPVQIQVENRGAVGAREVRLAVRGDAELSEVPPIPALEAGARVVLPVNVRPKSAGRLALEIVTTYRRILDDAEYTANGGQDIPVQGGGTYLVEDVFVIHVDGRLLFHVGGANKEIDEDIFSGMLSVVQDFVRDAFSTRAGKGLRRFEFGPYKVLIERSQHLFVAVKVAGNEPELLALYMAETLRDAEDRYGAVLDKWGGLLNEVSGIEDLARRLLLVTDKPDAPLVDLAESPVTAALQALHHSRQVGADDRELRDLLAKAKSSAEGDVEIAWKLLGSAGAAASRAERGVEQHMASLVTETRAAVGELRSLGADMGQAQILVDEAEEACRRKDFGKVVQISNHLRQALDVARVENAAAALQSELRSLLDDLERCKGMHLHTKHVEEALVSVQEVIAAKDIPRAQGMIRRARQMLDEEKGKSASRWVQEQLAKLAKTLHEASSEGLAFPEVRDLLAKATAAASEGREGDARLLLETIEETVRPRIRKHLVDHFPRLFLHLERPSLQVGETARCVVALENRGNAVATDVELELSGDIESASSRKLGRVAPGGHATVSLAVRPRAPGPALIDARVRYRRPLEDAVHSVVDTQEVTVHAAGTYPVERALLFDAARRPVAQESRIPLEANDPLAAEIGDLLAQAFPDTNGHAFVRVPGEGATLLLERGGDRYLAAVCEGPEPPTLPLFMVDGLRLIVKERADPAPELAKLLWVSADPQADQGPLVDSPLLSTIVLVGGGSEGGLLQKARSVIEERDFDSAVRFLARAEETTVISRDELQSQLRNALGDGGSGSLSEEEMREVIEKVKRVLTAVGAARQRLGVHSRWPLRRVAVLAGDEGMWDFVTSFKKLLTTQTLAREFEVLRPGETWRGMHLELGFHPEHMNRIYKSWAKRVELMLKRQDPWKIRAGMDKGEYSVGIEGQKVLVQPEAVTFNVSLPAGCAEEPFPGGAVYVDGTRDAGIEGEGLARELIAAIAEERERAGVPGGDPVDAVVEADAALPAKLKDWLGLVRAEARIASLSFGPVRKGVAHPVGGGRVRLAIARPKG